MSVTQNAEFLFDLRENIIHFFGDYSFLLPEAKHKAKYGRALRIVNSKQMLQISPTAQ